MSVVVTGIGLVTPLGAAREKTWKALLDGHSGVRPSENGLEARVFDFSLNGARSRMGDFALLAAAEALQHAGFRAEDVRGKNIGCAVSQSKPLISMSDEVRSTNSIRHSSFVNRTPMDMQLLLSSFYGWSSESVVAREFGLEGPSTNVIAACATGIASIQAGVQWIESGLCDMVLVGAAESSLNDFYRSGFQRMGVLSDSLPCPFDKRRQGFVMGEGAAVMVLESEASSARRGKIPLARVMKAVLRQSGADALRFDPDGKAVARLLQQTVGSDVPGYINAHGTGTVFNDLAETRGIRAAFGNRADEIPISSTKAATGHLLGAAGAVEAALAVLALRDQQIPPTLNLTEPDPECNLNYVPAHSISADLSSTMSLSYGFGGQMGAVLFKHYE